MRQVRQAITLPGSVAACQYRAIVRAAVAVYGLEPACRLGLWLDAVAGGADRGVVRAAIRYSARLRTWLLLRIAKGQPLGWRLSRADYAVSLQLLEKDPCGPSWHIQQSGPSRIRRYQDADLQ